MLPTRELLILALPLLSAGVCRFVVNRNEKAMGYASSALMLAAALLSVVALVQEWSQPASYAWRWFAAGETTVTFGFFINQVTLIMNATVLIISFAVHLFSFTYMRREERLSSYYANLGLFTFSMVGIVLSDHLIALFMFWELVSFSSYRLISFWSQRPAAATAATKAFLMNRAGDCLMLCGLILAGNDVGWTLSGMEHVPVGPLTGLLLLFGILTKSAQFPFFSWLPDAMEAPTPVSALIHAATMVAAGVFLLLRIHFLFSAELLLLVAILGLITSLVGATGALLHKEIKRILAYSTISQLGLMLLAIGAGAPDAAFLLLITHAYFKSLLFLAAGALIHSRPGSAGYIHQVGTSWRREPFLFAAFLLGTASLAGLPLTAGFISKELLVETVPSIPFKAAIVFISGLTALYGTRLISTLFISEPASGEHSNLSRSMQIPIVLLMLGTTWMLVSPAPFQLEGWIPIQNLSPAAVGFWSLLSQGVVAAVIVTSVSRMKVLSPVEANVTRGNFGIDGLYQNVLVRPFARLAAGAQWFDAKVVDEALHQIAYIKVTAALATGWVDRIFVDGLVRLVSVMAMAGGTFVRSFVQGKIQMYILWASVALAIFMFILLR